jgi:NADH-quinone oxidoreductase subunit L
MVHAAYLMFVLPLAGFALLALAGRRLGDPLAGWVATATVTGSFAVACLTLAGLLSRPASARSVTQVLYSWIPVGGLHVNVALLVDPLSMTMAMFVTGVSALIHLYSIGYMKGDEDFPKFFVYMNLFVASMLILVLGDNLLFTFVGWEGVGVCSYWLIAFWFGRPSAASAGKKAFLYNRLADVGFLVAMFLVFDKTGTLDYRGIFSHLAAIDPASRTAIVLLLFAASVGKSAQIPLFPWLADAMEGPTPVSALIHAATMVTAGVYLMTRINPLLALSHNGQLVVAVVGVVTALVAATIACAQQDIKKVLAYSTVSQLGYMFLAVGTGAYEAAIFLMVAHAFFKAELFLGAGSVIHGLDDEQDLKRMGNLRRWMPLTFFTFVMGWLAIAGVPPLSGFWAKGDVLDNAYARFPGLWALGLLTAALTAYYMSRLSALAFWGDDRWRAVLEARPASAGTGAGAGGAPQAGGGPLAHHGPAPRPHEAPWVMAVPLVVLAVASFAGGVLLLPWHPAWTPLAWLRPVFGARLYDAHLSGALEWGLGVADAVVALVGLGAALPLWAASPEHPALEPALLQRSYYLDDVYDFFLGRPGQALAAFALVVVDNAVIDGAVNAVGRLARLGGWGLRRVQTGFVRQYALGIVLGAAGLLAFMAFRAWA